VNFWHVATGQLRRFLEGHPDPVNAVAFDPTGYTLASASSDKAVKLWDVASGRLLRSLEGHSRGLNDVAFDPTGHTLASASSDRAVNLWDVASGRLLRSLEGHTGEVTCVAFSPDGRLLASRGRNDGIRLWRSDTGINVAMIAESSVHWAAGLAFQPGRSILATIGSDPDTPADKRGNVIHLWELDFDLLLGQAAAQEATTYTSAKIVLVGDSGVGKTGLGWRLAHGEFKEHASSHGQQFWVLDQLSSRHADGTQCEAVLWDLAGQPDYRMIHALLLDDADMALLLFDPTERDDPLHGVEFWLRQLQGSRSRVDRDSGSRTAPPTLLVAARCDRGTATLTREDLEGFCRQRGIRGYLGTSAKQGEGVNDLVAWMKALIPWQDMPTTVTTTTFKRIKDYVLELKERRQGKEVAIGPLELRTRLQKRDAEWQFTDKEMLTAVGHLENHGYVKQLRTSRGETCILLAPELLNNLAASFILEARRNPKGLGSLEERRLLASEYSFCELQGLSAADRDILLDSAALLFLEHNVCFRETSPLTSTSYLVFPDLINLKRPTIADGKPTEDGASYTVIGAVENVHASLVVLLGYTQTFTRIDQWRNHARYEVGGALVCGFRQEAERDGELDFVLYFGTDVGKPIRTLFQGLFESFLARRNLTVFRYEPTKCAQCKVTLERAVMRDRLREGKTFTFCNNCGGRLSLPRADEPIQLREQQVEIDTQRRMADLRSRFEQAVFCVQNFAKQQDIKPPTCFISYAWGEPQHERWVEKQLATDLHKAGIDVVLDRWENAKIGASVARFVERIVTSARVVVVGTPSYRQKYDNKDPKLGFAVAAEGDLIANRMMGTEAEKASVLPVLLEGSDKSSFPPLLKGRVYADFRDQQAYFTTAFDLILSLYDIAPSDPSVADLRESLCEGDRG
jgi:GTPase SAR1 family protein